MDADSIPDLERLLREIRFEPPPRLVLPPRSIFPPWRWRPLSLLVGLSAGLCVMLLLFAFWTVLLGLNR